MNLSAKNASERYGFAVLTVAVSIGLRIALTPLLGTTTPFILLYPAVAISALYGGARAGLLTTALGGFCAVYFVMDPRGSFGLFGPTEFIQAAVFVAMGGLISWIVSDRERASKDLATVMSESERRTLESEEALRASKERARLAESSASIGIWEWDLSENKVEWSEGIYELLGYEPFSTEASVDVWYRSMLPGELQAAQEKIKKFIDDGSNDFYDEFRLKRKSDGRIIWIATQGRIIRDEERAIRLFGVNYDITAIKEKESKIVELNRELNLRVRELQTIFDLTPVGVAVARDAACSIITANPALAQMVGVKAGDNISSTSASLPYRHIKNGRILEPHELPMQRAVAEKRTIVNEELEIERADGTRITIYSYAAPVFDGDGDVVSCVAAQIDITDRKQRELKRERDLDIEQSLRKEAEEANRLKDEFLATVSHELRTPLNSIIGWTAMLRESTLNEELHTRAVAAIERGARSQSQLIEDLLDVSRIISGKLELTVKPVDISAVVAAEIETLRPAAEAKQISVTLNADAGSVVLGDRDRLQQVVWNILSNAVKFTPRGGSVNIGIRCDDGEVEIVVSDTGKGISPDFLPLVFDRFRQADGSITRAFTGLGLGLSIVRHLVELHGGSVDVTSEGEDQGATFYIRLPAVTPEQDLGPIERELPVAGRSFALLSGAQILVVDDEADVREILRIGLEKHGVKVTCASSAQDALEKARTSAPGVIVSDIGMPDEDGYSLIAKIRDLESTSSMKRTPAIALTAYARREDRDRALAAGFDAHVAKPVEPLHLFGLISEMLAAEKIG